MDLSIFPPINASFNATAAVFLFFGYRAVKKGNTELHKKLMALALVASTAFFSCYLYYHINVAAETTYQGANWFKYIYFFILITHIPLATLMLPFIFYAVIMAIKGNIEKHKKVVKYLWPVWMYVSVTGVLIYLILYVF
ncbi:hypothetical protein BVY03_02320 [bacterium K02(2017)]|nr:hypothetical protein BVY03_02320 [bacterium K02(2017)]